MEKELKELKLKNEELKIYNAKMENDNKLMNTEIENIKYKNTVNEKKIYVSNCEIQEMDKTIKYLKKNLEQTKMMNDINNKNKTRTFNEGCRTICNQCGCSTNINNYYSYNGNEIDIQKLIEDNKTLNKNNKELKNQINNMVLNLDLYINENNLATNRINKLENYIKNK